MVDTKTITRDRITRVFEQVRDHYKDRGVAVMEIIQGHDVQAFYRLSQDPSRVVHVQGYPGMSTDKEMRVWARLMDYNKMMELRRDPQISPGNEHEAQIQPFPNFGMDNLWIPYDSLVLEEKLEENLPELKVA